MELSAQAKVRAQLAAMKSALGDKPEVKAPQRTLPDMRQQQDQRVGDAAQRFARLRQIEIALERLERGKYGYCALCNAAIEDWRLQNDPTTIHCSRCGGDQQ